MMRMTHSTFLANLRCCSLLLSLLLLLTSSTRKGLPFSLNLAMDGRPPSHTAPKRTYTQPTSADFPIRSIIENITSSLPSFGVPPSSQDPARPNTAPIPHNHPVPKSAPYTSSSSSWWPFGASSSTRSASVPAQRPTGSKPWRTYLPSDPALSGALSGSAAVVVTLAGIWGYRRYGRRIRNADYVTSKMLERKTWVRGVVTS